MNNLLLLTFLLSLNQPYHGSGPVNTPEHTLYVLAASGWYTPEARRALFQVPLVDHCNNPTSAGCFADDGLTQLGFAPRVWQGSSSDAVLLFVHEFNHYFDYRYGDISQTADWAKESARAVSVYGYHKTRYSLNERYALMGQRPWLFPQLRRFYPQFTDAAFVAPSPLPY